MVVVIKQKKSMNADTKALLSQVAIYLNEYVQTVDETLKKTKAFKDIDNILNAVARAMLNPVTTQGVPPNLGLVVTFSTNTFGSTHTDAGHASTEVAAVAQGNAFVEDSPPNFINDFLFLDDSEFLPLTKLATLSEAASTAPEALPIAVIAVASGTASGTAFGTASGTASGHKRPKKRITMTTEDDGAQSDTTGYLTEGPDEVEEGGALEGGLPFPHEITFSAAAKPGDHPLFIDSRDIQEIITHLQTLYAWTPRKRTHQSNIRACLKLVRRLNVSWGPTNGSQVQKVHETLTTACDRLDKWVQRMIQKAPKVKLNDKAFKAEAKFFSNIVEDYRSMIQSDLEKYSTTKKRKRTAASGAPVAAVAQEGAEGKKTNDTLSLQFLDFQNSQVTPPSSPLEL